MTGIAVFSATCAALLIVAAAGLRLMRGQAWHSTKLMWGSLIGLAGLCLFYLVITGNTGLRIDNPRNLLFATPILLGFMLIHYRAQTWTAREWCHVIAYAMCITLVVNIYLSLAASMAMPLYDAHYAAADAWFGFDWRIARLAGELYSQIWIGMAWVYHGAQAQMGVLILLLMLNGYFARVRAVLLASLWTLICIGIIFGLFPALGVGYYFYDGESIPPASRAASETILALRGGKLSAFALSYVEGFVSFPSFHASLALFCIYLAWPLRDFRLIFLALNMVMLLATVVVGEHYLVDVLFSIPMTALMIYLAHRAVHGDEALLAMEREQTKLPE